MIKLQPILEAVQSALLDSSDIVSWTSSQVWREHVPADVADTLEGLYIVWETMPGMRSNDWDTDGMTLTINVHAWGETDQDIECSDLQSAVESALDSYLAGHLPGTYRLTGVEQIDVDGGLMGDQYQVVGTYELHVATI